MNEKTLSLFSLIYSGKPIKHVPILKDIKNQIPEQMNFANCESLITHNDIQGNQLKQALIFCMGHRQGCLVCLHILNRTGLKWKVFPHLWSTLSQRPFYPSTGIA